MPTSGELERERIRQKQQIYIADLSVCYNCKSKGLTENDTFCPNCGFPQRGTVVQQRIFVAKTKAKAKALEAHKRAVKRARNILFIVAAVNTLLGIVFAALIPDQQAGSAALIICLVIGVVFAGLGFWCNSNPFPAILTGLLVYILLIAVNAFIDPKTLYQGLIMKIIVISALVYGYKGVKEAEKLEKEIEQEKTAVDLTTQDAVPKVPE